MANYNDAAYLRRAIESVIAQSRRPEEFLILDDASTDESVAIIEAYARCVPYLRLIRQPTNQGVNAAYRRLFEASRGAYVRAIAADDEQLPGGFERAMAMAARYPEAGIIMGDLIIHNGTEPTGRISIRCWSEPLFADPRRYLTEYLRTEPPSHSLVGSTLFRRAALEEVGWYQAELGSWGDTFSLHAVALKYGACYLPEPFLLWRKLPDTYSQQTARDPRRTIDVINRAALLMRSDRFRERFPESFVKTWRRRYLWRTIKEYWRGDHTGVLPPQASFITRYRYRLPRTAAAVTLLFHRTPPQ